MKDLNKNESSAVLSHPLCIARIDVLLKLLIREKNIEKESIPQILAALGMSLFTAPAAGLEAILYHNKIRNEQLLGPLFVMGHWRSGTTLVQYLLSQDKSFGTFNPMFNSTYCFYFTIGEMFRKTVSKEISGTRPLDNMRLSMDLPLEEYTSFCKIEADSIYPVNYFPQTFPRYMDLSYWQDLAPEKAEKLKRKYDLMLKKCSLANDHKRLLLKSPDNTGRIGVLHEMYPDAQFFNIYRNPYEVIRSSVHLYETTFDLWSLQKPPAREDLEDWIIDNFKRMYENFFAVVPALPAGSFYEVRFEDFEKDPIAYLKEAYETLGLDGFEEAKPGFEAYLEEEKNYQKNKFDYPASLQKKVEDKLGFYFEHYGYPFGVLPGSEEK